MKRGIFSLVFLGCALASFAIPSPTKRGICYNDFTQEEIDVLDQSKVTWAYNWYQFSNTDRIGPNQHVEFMPMVWGAGEDFDAMVSRTREYLSKNKKVRVLLGFNEPMMKGQYGGCDLSPKEAAKKWPELEKIAKDFKIELAGPALTWGFEPLSDGKIYTPEGWMDAFIEEYKKMNKKREPRFDYVVLHSYMDYPSAVMWFCKTYGERYNKKVLLTEFCAWDQDPNQLPHQSLEAQTIAMAQKVEAMDSEDIVAGYAWFMSHGAVDAVPFNSVFTQKGSDGSLTELGKVFLYMADVTKPKSFSAGDVIPAYEYVSSSNYNKTVGEKCDDGVRFNTPVSPASATDPSDVELLEKIPLELSDFSNKRFANYSVVLPETKTYSVKLRILTDKPELYIISQDGKEVCQKEIEGTGSEWKTVELEAPLTKGKHEIQVKTLGNARLAKFFWFVVE